MDIESLLPPRREILVFVALFALFFGVYSIPAPGLGRFFATVASAVASGMAASPKDPAALYLTFRPAHEDPRFDATKRDAAWTTVLEARAPSSGREARVNINLRRSLYMPMAMFTALALASPIWKGRRGLVVLLGGVGLLFFPVALWIVVPTLALLYEAMVIDFGPFGQNVIRIVYALIEPPGMIYAIPLFVWAGLVWWTRPREAVASPT